MWKIGDICWIYRDDLDKIVKCTILRPTLYGWKLVETNSLMVNWYTRKEDSMFTSAEECFKSIYGEKS
jgi:hypothetical protein